MARLSIVIPCYNEEKNLPTLVDKCSMMAAANADIEIVLVNNGSTDGSAKVLDELLRIKNLSNIRSHLVPVNKGYGYGIMEGLKSCNSEILCWTHADLQTDITDCLKAYQIFQTYKNDYLVVKGRRKSRGLLDVLFTFGMSLYVLFKLKVFLSDINGQPKLFSKKLFDEISANAPVDFSLDLYFLLNGKRRYKIVDFPVYFHKRVAGEAKGGGGSIKLKIKLTKRTISYINNFKM